MAIIMEIWKSIPGYEGLYELNNNGVVRMVGRKKRHRNGTLIDVPQKILSQFLVCGYMRVKLRDANGKTKLHSVHRLVADVFIPNPHRLPQVNHKDENKLNNNVHNLEWCTAKYNTNYGNGILKCSTKRMVPVAQLNENNEIVDTWPGVTFAAEKTGIQQSSISCCLHGKLKHAGGYKWKYLNS